MAAHLSAGDLEVARAYLGRHGWLTETPASFRAALLARCTIRIQPRGSVLYRVGEEPLGFFGVFSGCIAVGTTAHERGTSFVNSFRPGSWFGASAMLKGCRRLGSAVARRPSRCLHISAADFKVLASVDPEAWRWLGALCFANVEIGLGVVDDLTIRASDRRIAAILLRLAGVRKKDVPEEPQPELELTQDELAHLTNVARATAADYLSRLESQGLIARTYGRVRLLDPAGLRRLAEPAQPKKARGRRPDTLLTTAPILSAD